MIYGIYSVKDIKTGYLPPTFDMNDLSAMRNFEHACMNEDSLFFTHPADYQLYKVGSFDTETGSITDEIVFLMDAPVGKEVK